ncbi:hypothetical protein [Streptomyces sp. MBT60]|nr:hypothetical protein [Streptomyces sp. MBT60]MBK3548081.1 hypothetical protein [Streptomyces sp. MBT60]
MDEVFMSADNPTPFWPTGAIILAVISVISLSIGIWRNRRMKQGKDY